MPAKTAWATEYRKLLALLFLVRLFLFVLKASYSNKSPLGGSLDLLIVEHHL